MRKAEEDYTGLSLGVSPPATSTPSAQRKVGLVLFSTYPSVCELVFRMGAFDVRLLAIGSCQGSDSETRRLYG